MPSPSDHIKSKKGKFPEPGFGQRVRPGLYARLSAVKEMTPRAVLRSPLILPVMLGEELSIEEEYPWEDFTTVGDGEHSVPSPGGGAQARFTGETLSLTWSPVWLANPHISPEKMRRELQRIGQRQAVFDLLIVNKPGADFAEFAGYATIRRMTKALRRGEADTRYYSIDFVQYRPMGVGRKSHSFGANTPTTTALSKEDTLRSLAREYLGNESFWRDIAQANGLTKWGSNDPIVDSKAFKPGDKIKLPNSTGAVSTTGGLGEFGAIAEGRQAN